MIHFTNQNCLAKLPKRDGLIHFSTEMGQFLVIRNKARFNSTFISPHQMSKIFLDAYVLFEGQGLKSVFQPLKSSRSPYNFRQNMVGRFVYNKRNRKDRFGNFPLETGLACTGKYININFMRLDGRR